MQLNRISTARSFSGTTCLVPAAQPAARTSKRAALLRPCRFKSTEVSPEFMSAFQEAMSRQSCQIAERIGVPLLSLDQAFDAEGCSGHVVWSAGVELATYVRNHLAKQVKGAKVLELGSGTGIVGLTAAALGASVTITDLPRLLPQLNNNMMRNIDVIREQGGCLQVLPCDWAEPNPVITATKYDVILGSDLVYEDSQLEPLLNLLVRLIKANPQVTVLLSHHHREAQVDAQLAACLAEQGLKLEALQKPSREDIEDIQIYQLISSSSAY